MMEAGDSCFWLLDTPDITEEAGDAGGTAVALQREAREQRVWDSTSVTPPQVFLKVTGIQVLMHF